VHLGFELVPERLALAGGVLLESLLVCARAQDPADVFAEVVFGVDISRRGGGAGDCSCDGDCRGEVSKGRRSEVEVGRKLGMMMMGAGAWEHEPRAIAIAFQGKR
jgi:hypothetical protein